MSSIPWADQDSGSSESYVEDDSRSVDSREIQDTGTPDGIYTDTSSIPKDEGLDGTSPLYDLTAAHTPDIVDSLFNEDYFVLLHSSYYVPGQTVYRYVVHRTPSTERSQICKFVYNISHGFLNPNEYPHCIYDYVYLEDVSREVPYPNDHHIDNMKVHQSVVVHTRGSELILQIAKSMAMDEITSGLPLELAVSLSLDVTKDSEERDLRDIYHFTTGSYCVSNCHMRDKMVAAYESISSHLGAYSVPFGVKRHKRLARTIGWNLNNTVV